MHRMGDFGVGKFSAQLLFHFFYCLVTLLRAFGKFPQHLVTHTLDFKAVLRDRGIAGATPAALTNFSLLPWSNISGIRLLSGTMQVRVLPAAPSDAI